MFRERRPARFSANPPRNPRLECLERVAPTFPLPMASSAPDAPTIAVDVLIVGGGVAGLWTLHSLVAAGYRTVLAEANALGDGQTVASQGVIHGGLKYAGAGKLNDASEELEAMPGRWRDSFEGRGGPDLSGARQLAPCQHLWTRGRGTSAVVGFFASKAVKGRTRRLKRPEFPAPLDHERYRGQVFELAEFVVDTPGVVEAMAARTMARLIQADITALARRGDDVIAAQASLPDGDTLRIDARHVVLCAGAGNSACLASLGLDGDFPMQRRPLHQVMVKHPALPPFYSVCLGTSPKPPLVCTTHFHPDGEPVWYLGGQLAEKGIEREPAEQAAAAADLLDRLLPWIDLEDAGWATLPIDRAEARTADRSRHPGAWVETRDAVTAVWPSKLALAPDAADQVLSQLAATGLKPAPAEAPAALSVSLAAPPVAASPWDRADFQPLGA